MNDKKITYKTIDGIEEIKSCQVLYMEETHWIKDKRLKEHIEKYSVLTIADTGNQSAYASMINLQLENKKYSFTINNQVVKEASLTLSSKLLRLATRVY
ncbi:MAG: YfiR family protein [Methylophilus sp.]|nr:YfiR family protein [Methylophilus sp.]